MTLCLSVIVCVLGGRSGAQESGVTIGQAPATEQPAKSGRKAHCLMIHASRPMAELARAVANGFGAVVTYEDPRFASARDTFPVIPNASARVPRHQSLCVTYAQAATAEQVLTAALGEHNATGHGGRFAMVKNQGILGLVPTHCENEEGQVVKHRSILDRNVSFVLKEDATCLEAMNALVRSLSRSNPEEDVKLGRFPRASLKRTRYPHLNVSKRARDVLTEILVIQNRSLLERGIQITWQLWYFPPVSRTAKAMWGLYFMKVQGSAIKPIMMRVLTVRPMSTVLEMLQRRYAVVVTYEEPVYQCRCDVLGKAGTVQARLAGGIIRLGWALEQDSVEQVLPMLMKTRIEPRDTDRMFAVREAEAGRYHVYPMKARNVQGDLIPVKPLMSKRITLKMEKVTSAKAIEAVCAAVSNGGPPVALAPGSPPIAKTLERPLPGPLVTDAQEARDVLGRVLWAADPELSWQCLFDPGTGKHRLIVYDPF